MSLVALQACPEYLVMFENHIPFLIIFFILIAYLLDSVLKIYGEFTF